MAERKLNVSSYLIEDTSFLAKLIYVIRNYHGTSCLFPQILLASPSDLLCFTFLLVHFYCGDFYVSM